MIYKGYKLIVDQYIITILFFVILIFESLKILNEVFTYGFFKKEVLTSKSNLGFDIKIKVK